MINLVLRCNCNKVDVQTTYNFFFKQNLAIHHAIMHSESTVYSSYITLLKFIPTCSYTKKKQYLTSISLQFLWIICVNQIQWFSKLSEVCVGSDKRSISADIYVWRWQIHGGHNGSNQYTCWSFTIFVSFFLETLPPLMITKSLLQSGPHLEVGMVKNNSNEGGKCYTNQGVCNSSLVNWYYIKFHIVCGYCQNAYRFRVKEASRTSTYILL